MKQRDNFDIGKLNDQKINNMFSISLKNKFQALEDLHTEENTNDINKEWEKIASVIYKTSEEILGYKKKDRKKAWISENTWEAIKNRKELRKKLLNTKSERLKDKLQKSYSQVHKEVKRLIKSDKQMYLNNLASQAEDASNRGEISNLYKITKIISGRNRTTPTVPIKDKEGKIITNEKQQEISWNEYFLETINRPPPTQPPNLLDAQQDLEINTEPPQKVEIITAIKSLKNGKAAGHDNLKAELFKADPNTTADLLLPLFTTIWNKKKQVPESWNKGIIIKIPKKGNLSDCNNWRGITLLPIAGKIMAKIVLQRISKAIDNVLRNEQAGFRRGRSCTDQIFALRNIIEQSNEWQRQLYINFVDFEKAFDSIHRDSLWRILRSYGIPQHIVQIIQSLYTNFRCSVGNSNLSFEVKTGVRQGCVLSAVLFNVAIDWVMRQTTKDAPRGIRWTLTTTLEDLDYADDLALLSHTYQHIQEKTNSLHKYASQVGLNVNKKKSEVMTINANNNSSVKIEGHELPTTKSFTYLGSIVESDGDAGSDIQNRLGKARAAFQSMNKIWRSSQYSNHTKLKIYKSCVLTTLLYGSECWRTTEKELNKLSAFHNKNLRKILGIHWPQKITNTELHERTKQTDLRSIISIKKWRWIGHVLRKEDISTTKTALFWTPEGKRKKGRPKTTWRRSVEAEMRMANQTWGQLKKIAKDRQEWENFVAALHAQERNRK